MPVLRAREGRGAPSLQFRRFGVALVQAVGRGARNGSDAKMGKIRISENWPFSDGLRLLGPGTAKLQKRAGLNRQGCVRAKRTDGRKRSIAEVAK